MSRKRLVLIGDSVFAQIACEFFQFDSDYEVVAFAVERRFLKRRELFERPIVAFEDLPDLYSPSDHFAFVAIVFTQFNRLRTRLYRKCKSEGYRMASYISSAALVRPRSKIGEHCFICEDTVVQPFAEIGNNVVVWSGNQICHRCRVGDNSFLLPNCIVSDGVRFGENAIVGANVTVMSDRTIGKDCYLGPAALVDADLPDGSVFERIPTGSAPKIPIEEPDL